MRIVEGKLDKKAINRLQKYGILISKNSPTINKERALVLIGEAMLDRFIKEFSSLWKNELFADCLLRDFEASEQEENEIFGGNCLEKYNNCQPIEGSQSYSNECKEVNNENKMDSDTKKRLNKYIELFEEISKKIENENVAVTLLTEISKDRRAEQMRNERQTKDNDAVTFKQKKCMQSLGIDFPDNITRKEASVLITPILIPPVKNWWMEISAVFCYKQRCGM